MMKMLAIIFCSLFSLSCFNQQLQSAEPSPAKVGDQATDFELKNLAGANVTLSNSLKEGPVVVVVLRGYPGYQCPLCTVQVGQFLAKADQLAKSKTRLLFVYPGPSSELQQKATEFLKETKLPANVELLLDPDYVFTKQYNLRWEAPRETAYPATFVIDSTMKITFSKVSKTHGDRAKIVDVLQILDSIK
jgi:thioredoxin-dependent peroxiredoxin